MNEPIPFHRRSEPSADYDLGADATEVPAADRGGDAADLPAGGRPTTRLPALADAGPLVSDILQAPLGLLPAETQAHLRTAGREAMLTVTSLAGSLLKGAAIVLNIAGETLKDYSMRNSAAGAAAAGAHRQAVEIEVE